MSRVRLLHALLLATALQSTLAAVVQPKKRSSLYASIPPDARVPTLLSTLTTAKAVPTWSGTAVDGIAGG